MRHFGSMSTSRRTLLLGVGAAALPVVPGCQMLGAAAANPAVQAWLVTLSATLGANIVTDFSKKGADATAQEWGTGFWSLYRQWFPERGENGCAVTPGRRSEGNPAFMLVRTVAQETPTREACQQAENDPLNDGCGIVINKGADGLHLSAWAWHTISMFCTDVTRGQGGAGLERTKKLLAVALGPTSSHTDVATSWANAVAYVSYMTHLGPVDVAKVEQPDHSFHGMIKVSGFPDENRRGTVWEFPLPTRRG